MCRMTAMVMCWGGGPLEVLYAIPGDRPTTTPQRPHVRTNGEVVLRVCTTRSARCAQVVRCFLHGPCCAPGKWVRWNDVRVHVHLLAGLLFVLTKMLDTDVGDGSFSVLTL